MKTFELATKKSKRRNLLKSVALSSLGTAVLLAGAYLGLNNLTSSHAWKIVDYYEVKSQINAPNISNVDWSFKPTSQFSGLFKANQVKDVAGILVPFEDFEVAYSWSPRLGIFGQSQDSNSYKDANKTSLYTHGQGYKLPLFFNTAYDYSQKGSLMTLTQDIALLPQMASQAVEVALTFDKPYTYEEIAERIPDTLKINWYWIGTKSDYDTASLGLEDQLGFSPNFQQTQNYDQMKETEGDYQAHLKELEKQPKSQRFANSYTVFKANLEQALAKDWLSIKKSEADGTNFDLKEDAAAYLKDNPDGKTAKFAGVILTGRAEDFASLEQAKWIFASNIGLSVEIQPYHQLKIEP